MQIEFSIQDRIVISTLYPERGNIITQMLVKDISKKVEISQDQLKEYGITIKGDQYHWENEFDIMVELSDQEIQFLKGRVTELDNENAVTKMNVDLCIKVRNLKESE